MALDGILRGERDVVTALDHARAAALAEEAFHGDGDREIRIVLVRVQRGEQARAAGTEDEHVGAQRFHRLWVQSPEASNASRYAGASAVPSSASWWRTR